VLGDHGDGVVAVDAHEAFGSGAGAAAAGACALAPSSQNPSVSPEHAATEVAAAVFRNRAG